MISTIILNAYSQKDLALQYKLVKSCPQLKITNSDFLSKKSIQLIEKEQPELVFLRFEKELSQYSDLFNSLSENAVETILIVSKKEYIFEVIKYNVSGYLVNPFDVESLKSTVDNVIRRILNKQKMLSIKKSYKNEEVIGIPTMEGYEFIAVNEIIRCESYLKCTRVITINKVDVISSYNIGEFSKLLENYHFYSPHQSHLINLSKLKKYLKEGTLVLQDGSNVPISRRRRNEFLSMIPHL